MQSILKQLTVCLIFFAALIVSCEEIDPGTTDRGNESGKDVFELVSPVSDDVIDLEVLDSLTFEWIPVEGVNSYRLLLSLDEDMSGSRQIIANADTVSVDAKTLDGHLQRLGLEYEETAVIYVAVAEYDDETVRTPVVALTMKRRKEEVRDNSARIAEPINVKVAIVVEDFVIPQAGGKRIHEVCALHAPGGFYQSGGGWNDPYKQMKEFERDLEASSHGVVQYEVVEVREADRMFTYFKDGVRADGTKEYLTLDTLLYLFETRQVDNLTSYDYVEMMKHYGYGEMVDAGELDEVWVYTFPAAGMYESQMMGNGAFWCNSPGLSITDGAPCNNLCIVMCCNFERTTDLALHAYCHRVESIMNEVFRGWNYDRRKTVDELTNWEKFSAYELKYSKFKDSHAHIGMCHWPPNSEFDYDYGNPRYVYTYADTWYDYPDIKEENPRRVNKNEWRHEGGDQWGYMMWYYDHIPHFKGLCPRDGHLNNWWHYIVKYREAKALEKQLQAEMNENQ